MRGTLDQAVDYACKDDKEPMIFGVKPESAGEREKSRFAAARQQAMTGNPDAVMDDQIYITHFSNISRIAHRALAMRDTKDLDQLPDCYWLYGVPGAGKSFFARQMFPALYVKEPNQWWNNYIPGHHTCVLIEDLDPSHAYMAHYVKTWTDRYAFRGNVKNEDPILIRPPAFVITSNYSVEQVFGASHDRFVDCQAIRRRMKVIRFDKPYVEGVTQVHVHEPYVPPVQLAPGLTHNFNNPVDILAPVKFYPDYEGAKLPHPIAPEANLITPLQQATSEEVRPERPLTPVPGPNFQTPPPKKRRVKLEVPATQPLDEDDEYETCSEPESGVATSESGSRSNPYTVE